MSRFSIAADLNGNCKNDAVLCDLRVSSEAGGGFGW
jgi:hypothetical protein